MSTQGEEILKQVLAAEAREAPSAAGLADAVRRRHRRRRNVYAVATTFAVVGTTAVITTALNMDRQPVDVASNTPVVGQALPTSGWPESDFAAHLHQEGVLTATSEACFYLDRGDDLPPIGLLWPQGWTWTTTDDDTVEIRDETGTAVMSPGDEIHVSGGYDPAGTKEGDICGVATGIWFPMNQAPSKDES